MEADSHLGSKIEKNESSIKEESNHVYFTKSRIIDDREEVFSQI